MKHIIFIIISLFVANTFAASKIAPDQLRPIQSEAIRALIHEAIDAEMYWAEEEYADELGSMWVSNEIEYAIMNIVGPMTKDSESGALIMNTFTEIGCGSELDSSEFYGSCEVQLQKIKEWKVTNVTDCTCDPYH